MGTRGLKPGDKVRSEFVMSFPTRASRTVYGIVHNTVPPRSDWPALAICRWWLEEDRAGRCWMEAVPVDKVVSE